MAGKIFINYRRGDDSSAAQALLGRLEQAFLPEQLFMDVDNIEPGNDFVRVLNDQVAQCDVLISIIGKNWLDARDERGAKRLDNPEDFVRLEIETALQQDNRVIPVLVGQVQMPRPDDLPESLRPLARRNAVRLTHERFRSDAQGLIKALEDGLKEIEAQREAEAEANRRAQAEAAQKQREAEAAREAAEEERRRRAEIEASARAAAEREQRQTEAKQRAQAELAFNRARRVGTVLALDGFLTTHGTSDFADEAQTLRAVLLAREGAYRDAAGSDDPAALRSFIATYSKGADVDHARRRLRRLEGQNGWRLSAGIMIAAGLALILIGGGGAYWIVIKRPPSVSRNVPATATEPPVLSKHVVASVAPDQAAWDLLKDTTDPNALRRFIAEYPTSPLRKQAEERLATLERVQPAKPASPRLDELAWQLVKDTTDEAELKRFLAQFPDSPLRRDAEAQIAALEVARAAKAPQPRADEIAWTFLKGTTDEEALKRFIAQYPDSMLRKSAEAQLAALEAVQTAWNNVKDSNDPDRLRQFVEQYPGSVHGADAERRIASLATPPPASVAPSAPSPHELTRALQLALERVGCFTGALNGEFDDRTKVAWHRFTKLASLKLPDDATPDALNAVRKFDKRVCPLVCPEGQQAEGERCISVTPHKPRQRKAERSKVAPRKNASLDRPSVQQARAQRDSSANKFGPEASKTCPNGNLHCAPRRRR